MLVCMKCHLEFEEGTPFCSNCGGDLVTKKGPKSAQQEVEKKGEGRPDGRLICPKCHILYEKLTSCIRCGTPLVTQSALKEMGESPPPPRPESRKLESGTAHLSEMKKEPPSVPPSQKPLADSTRVEPKQPKAAEIQQAPPTQAADKVDEIISLTSQREKRFQPEKSKKSFFYSLHGILSIILVLMVAIYLLITQLLRTRSDAPGTPIPQKIIEQEAGRSPSPSKEVLPVSPDSVPVVLLPQEIQKLQDLLENVRQANLKKNIDLLMSCYASEYKDLEERRRTALQFWSKHNYLDLEYTLKVESVSIDSAKARVEWRIRSIPLAGGPIEEGKSVLNVIFKKEKNKWKIVEVAPGN